VESGPFAELELGAAIAAAKKGRAPGFDGLPAEAWKVLSGGRAAVFCLLNRCWNEGRFPEAWRRAMVVGVFRTDEATCPSNYRPISLLATVYKLFGRILAARLQTGLDEALRCTQFGFRRGRSTAEPLFVVRRVQDLVHGRQNQALHLIFLDWANAFDKVDTRCLASVLKRYSVPERVVSIVVSLVAEPSFTVSMAGGQSAEYEQGTGIRQGCTLSPFLFTLVLLAVMHDAVGRVHREHPLAVTPVMLVSDLDYADDTVLMAGTAALANALLQEVQREAEPYGLRLNEGKTERIAMDSDAPVFFQKVPRVECSEYLGAVIHEASDPGPEVRARAAKAMAFCTALRPLLELGAVGKSLMVMLVEQCVFASLTYGLHTMVCSRAWETRVDSVQARCLRRALRIRTTHASRIIGEDPVTNEGVLRRSGVIPLSARIEGTRFQLLGHALRADGGTPARAVAFDRFGFPRELRSTRKAGDQRLKWSKVVLAAACSAIEGEGALRGASPRGHRFTKVAALAQDRQQWRKWIKAWLKKQGL